MSSILETAEKEVIRQEIMTLCQIAAPEGVNTRIVKASLKKTGYDLTEKEISRQADYLRGKGLLSVVRISNSKLGIGREIIKITPAGTDYLESNSGDITGIED